MRPTNLEPRALSDKSDISEKRPHLIAHTAPAARSGVVGLASLAHLLGIALLSVSLATSWTFHYFTNLSR